MNAILKKQAKIQSLSKLFLIRPEGTLKFSWDLFMLLILIILGVLIPYILAFEDEGSTLMTSIDIATLILFTLDIVLTFNTSYYEEGNLIEDRRKIMKNYLKFWFWVDLTSILPISFIMSTTNLQNTNGLVLSFRILKLSKLIRLIRIAKLDQLVFRVEETLTSNASVIILRCLKYCFFLFFVANLFACSMFATSSSDNSPCSFLNLILDKNNEKNMENFEIYINCLYWAFVTMASVGYGDFSPQSTSERLLGIFIMFGSSGTFGVLLGLLSSFIDKQAEKDEEYRKTMISLNKFFKQNKINEKVRSKCRNFLEYTSNHDFKSHEYVLKILETLPESLQAEIMQYSDSIIVSKSNLFSFISNDEIKSICRLLHIKIFYHKDLIIQEKEKPKAIFFLRKGFANILDITSRSQVCTLKSGEHFGEIGFFTGESCVSSVISDGFSEALVLKLKSFEKFAEKNLKVLGNLERIKEETKDGDLSCLGIRCYLCLKIGHVAVRCKDVRKFDETKKIWLRRKINSKMINPSIKRMEKVQRIKPFEYFRVFKGRNVMGKKRKAWQVFKTDSKLKSLVKFFYNEYKSWREEGESDASFSLMSYESWRSNESEMKIKETINMILDDSDEEIKKSC